MPQKREVLRSTVAGKQSADVSVHLNLWGANAFPYFELHSSLGHAGRWHSHSGIAGHLGTHQERMGYSASTCSILDTTFLAFLFTYMWYMP